MYLDHAATTPVRPEVLEAMLPYLREQWGNPSSLHAPGRQARQAVDRARRTIADIFGCSADEIVFTASGSEGANLAIQGAVFAAPAERNQIITSRVEHHAVLDTCKWLSKRFGFDVTYLDVDEHGVVNLDQLEASIGQRTALVSIMYANNEVGTIQPIKEVTRLAHVYGVPVHTDAVQAAGSLSLEVDELGVDLLSVAGHKCYAPKGIGVLYVRRGTPLAAQIRGGGQERGRRSGTENVPYIVGMAEALRLAQAERESVGPRLWQMASRMLNELPTRVTGTRVTGHPSHRLPNHASFAFEDVEIESVLVGLDRQDIWASSGSACTSASSEPSHVLVAMNLPRRCLYGALRLTLGLDNQISDVDRVLDVLPPLVARARGLPDATSTDATSSLSVSAGPS